MQEQTQTFEQNMNTNGVCHINTWADGIKAAEYQFALLDWVHFERPTDTQQQTNRVPILLLTIQGPHEKFSRTISEPKNA